jgi:hypothetical protein
MLRQAPMVKQQSRREHRRQWQREPFQNITQGAAIEQNMINKKL